MNHLLQRVLVLHMLDLVGEHARELLGAAGLADQSCVDHDDAAGERERIHFLVFAHVPAIFVFRSQREACAELGHGLRGEPLLGERRFHLDLRQRAFADVLFGLLRDPARKPCRDAFALPPHEHHEQHAGRECSDDRRPLAAMKADVGAAAAEFARDGRRRARHEQLL